MNRSGALLPGTRAPGPQASETALSAVTKASKEGCKSGIMRFIAFAYTYHYLNWFSKTEIIRWHQVPRSRFIIVVLGAVASVALYAIDYSLGFKWLFLLSFMHVMLEFPLNWITATGIFTELNRRLTAATTPP